MPGNILILKLLFLLLMILQESISDRRIKGGRDLTSDKRYAVYLLKPADAVIETLGWTCGGAIVSRSFVVTAAACVDDLQRIYVIAGYKKFVTSSEIETDQCTSKMKKRVIFTCVPKEYNLDYNVAEGWARIDIGLVKVESPFDFTDSQYTTLCSYQPKAITINYWPKYQNPGTDSLTMGWGHLGQFKEDLQDVQKNNYNVDKIKYTPTRILDKKKCLSYFPFNQKMHPIIQKYMICTLEAGNLDDNGQLILRAPVFLEGCISKKDQENGMIGRTCEGEEVPINNIRRELINIRKLKAEDNKSNNSRKYQTEISTNRTVGIQALRTEEKDDKIAKEAPGICQNDHGGPLVSWEGRNEILLGVATLFKVDEESNCIGPYLFTSTHCTGAFLQCILSMEDEPESGRRCENSTDQPFEIIRRQISWTKKKQRVPHVKRKKPAQTESKSPTAPTRRTTKAEIVKLRPQVPIKNFHPIMVDKSLLNASFPYLFLKKYSSI